MYIDYNFKFWANISVYGYSTKEKALNAVQSRKKTLKDGYSKKLSFIKRACDIDDLGIFVSSGHAYCGALFDIDLSEDYWFENPKTGKWYVDEPYYSDGSLKLNFKTDDFFSSSQVISIDIDGTRFNDIDYYCSLLTLKPSFVYTSSSDDPNGTRRFRIIYIMSSLLRKGDYEYTTKVLHKMIQENTGETILDKCGEKFTQLFYGSYNCTMWKNFIIYSFEDDIKPLIDPLGIQLGEDTCDDDEKFNKKMVRDMKRMPYEKFMHYNSKRYKYPVPYSNIDWSDGLMHKRLGPDDFVLKYRWITEYDPELGMNITHPDKFIDGEHRRSRLLRYAKMRRIIRPDADPNEILYQLYVDCHRFFDNSDEVITIDTLMAKVESAFKFSIDELKQQFKGIRERNNQKYVINPSCTNKKGELQVAKKEGLREDIDQLYDRTLGIEDNLENLKQNNIKVEKSTLYQYCKDNNIETQTEISKDKKKIERDKKKIESLIDQGILDNIQPGLGLNKQLGQLREKGFKLSQELLITIKNIYHL